MTRLVGIVMGSDSDFAIMREAVDVCEMFDVDYEVTIVSAHRTPVRLMNYGEQAVARGLRVIIAGAGGAAHLPGMLASLTPLPVIGVPILSRNSIDGWDSVLSILQMPSGIPVATVALDGAKNAGLLAMRILGASDNELREKLSVHQQKLCAEVLSRADTMRADYPCDFKDES